MSDLPLRCGNRADLALVLGSRSRRGCARLVLMRSPCFDGIHRALIVHLCASFGAPPCPSTPPRLDNHVNALTTVISEKGFLDRVVESLRLLPPFGRSRSAVRALCATDAPRFVRLTVRGVQIAISRAPRGRTCKGPALGYIHTTRRHVYNIVHSCACMLMFI